VTASSDPRVRATRWMLGAAADAVSPRASAHAGLR
jgi:hypothetical protein